MQGIVFGVILVPLWLRACYPLEDFLVQLIGLHYRLTSAWRSFWHTMTSYDRHASHDSPYRTGQHVPLNQDRHAPLTSIATSAAESRPDLSSPFDEDIPRKSPSGIASPSRPYSPGMRSLSSQQRQSHDHDGGHMEIQMQSFHDGAPPPPPVGHSWAKIDRWTEKNYEELFDNLCDGCTHNDVNELEHELDCTLPKDVRESLQIHDGQERGGLPSGIIFGCMLLDCEEIVQEWNNWRKVNEEFLSTATFSAPQPPIKAFGGASSSAVPISPIRSSSNPLWRQQLLDKQDSQPPRAVQKAYAHPSWIPLGRDWGGNNIAVDLAPGPAGKWGQVIIFGRDYDCKYVVARSWAAFLATLADDITSRHVSIHEETGELRLLPFKNAEPPYLEILRWRTDQKFGRRSAKRRSAAPLETNLFNSKTRRDSPYGSPTPSIEERGRSPHRFPSRGPSGSPFTVSSPLAQVKEEASSSEKPTASLLSSSANSSDNNGKASGAVDDMAASEVSSPAQAQAQSESQNDTSTPSTSTNLDPEALTEMKNIEI